jgi:lysophospholipase L1-like esterase
MIKSTFNKKLAIAIAVGSLLSACDAEFDNPVNPDAAGLPSGTTASAGDLDLSRVVTLGDSLTAGYADGTLYLHGQENSYPAILAERFSKAGGGAFTQPLVNDDTGGLLFGGNTVDTDADGDHDFPPRLVFDAAEQSPEPLAATITIDPFVNPVNSGAPYNNMGVPGAKSFHLTLTNYGDPAGLLPSATVPSNPYFVRFASSATSSMIADAAGLAPGQQAPTFFILWIGNNDVLSYATSGGTGTDQTGNTNPATYGSSDITDPNVFASVYSGLVNDLSRANGNGLLVNIPDVSTIPFFTTVPHNPVPLNAPTAQGLNGAYANYNAAIQGALANNLISAEEAAARTIQFSGSDNNAVVILDETLTDLTGLNPQVIKMRQATANDLLVLTASSKIGTLANPDDPTSIWGVGVPLTDADVLIPSEIAAINTARTAFNATIKSIADSNPNLAFFDAAAMMAELKANGLDYGTGKITSAYATGGGFSLDGVHPTARGYAVIANLMIDAINSSFNANIPKTDPGAYTTIFIK